MADREPIDVKNLDIYGNAPLQWGRVVDALSGDPGRHLTWYLGTVGPSGRPHAAGVGALYIDGDVFIVSGPKTRKSRNLASNSACTLSVGVEGLDLIFEGEAERATDASTLQLVVGRYRASGWPAEVDGSAFTAAYSAPSAGRPPWFLYRFTFKSVVAVASIEPHGATRWLFRSSREQFDD